jgi:cyanophycin synthetase
MHKLSKKEIANYKSGTQSILRAASRRNIGIYKLLEDERVFILKKGQKVFWFRGPRTSISNPVSLWIIKDKHLTKEILQQINFPYPEGYSVSTIKEALCAAKKLGFPLVIKPRSYEGGIGVFLNVNSMPKVKQFFNRAIKYDKHVLLEKQIAGKYYRITLVNHKIAGILETRGIVLTGDGINTVKQLISEYNQKAAKPFRLTKKTNDILLFQDLSPKSVPRKNKEFILGFSGSGGGEWIDRTDLICITNKTLFEKLSRYLDLKVVSVDLIAKDIALPITSKKSPGSLLEINGAPEFMYHLFPTEGKPRDIGEKIIQMLFD